MRSDPVTGEIIAGDANIGGPSLDAYRTSALLQYDLINGNVSDEELLVKWHKLIGYAGSSVDVDALAKELLALEKRPSMDGLI